MIKLFKRFRFWLCTSVVCSWCCGYKRRALFELDFSHTICPACKERVLSRAAQTGVRL